ncbi:MAG: hypothetical protein AAFO29_03990 [Actinomycetota bacterium]
MNTVTGHQPKKVEDVLRQITPQQLRIALVAFAIVAAAVGLILSTGGPGDKINASSNVLVGAQAATSGTVDVEIPPLEVDVPGADGTVAPAQAIAAPAADATQAAQPAVVAAPAAASDASATSDTSESAGTAETAASTPAESSAPTTAPAPTPTTAAPQSNPAPASNSGEPAVGSIKSKADEKGYDVHGHVEHSVVLLGQQVLIPGQAATGGFIQTSENNYLAYSPVTAMLPVAIQDNKEVLAKKPNLEGEQLYRRLAQEYTGSNDYKNLNRDAKRAINILTCTDWSLVERRVRENTINHLLHSPISFGTIGSLEDPISTDVKIDLGYTHTRDKNWTEVEYMGNNVYKITVVSNNNNGSHTGHEMGTAYVEMPAGTTLQEAKKIGNQMIPSTNKNNKLTIDPAARELFDTLPRGASPLILFEHLSEEEQNAFFEGRGIESVGQPNPDCNPLAGGILDPNGNSNDPTPDTTTPTTTEDTTPTTVDTTPTTMTPADETTSTTMETGDETTSTTTYSTDDTTSTTMVSTDDTTETSDDPATAAASTDSG